MTESFKKIEPAEQERFFTPDDTQIAHLSIKSLERRVTGRNSLVINNLSGQHYENLCLSIQPGTTTVVIGDNVLARRELISDIAHIQGDSSADINLPKDARIEYITPSLTDEINPELTLRDFFLSARGISGVEQQLDELWQLAAEGDEAAIKSAGELQDAFQNADGWNAERDISQIIQGLRLASSDHDIITLDTKLEDMSSGQISKAIIGRSLYSQANIVVMDDPSVHLDVRSKQWLTDYISQSDTSMIIATSDMSFAEATADRVVEILDSKLTLNIGTGLTNYQEERQKLIDNWTDEATRKKEDIQELKVKIRDFFGPAAKRTDDMAQVLRAQRSKLERMQAEYDAMPGKILIERTPHREVARSFTARHRSGTNVFSLQQVEMLYVNDSSDNEGTVIEAPDLQVYRGDRLAIIGNNGSGKSTLMKMLAEQTEEMLVEGEAKKGSSVEMGYFSPYTSLPDEDQPLRQILERSDPNAMGTLAFWGFNKRASYDIKPRDLTDKDSQARAQLALLMARQPNVLLLDEPTSYLTPSYQEKLVESLIDYDGTLLVISHDPHFLVQLGLTGRIVMPSAQRQNLHS